MKRKFIMEIEFTDSETPEENPLQVAASLKSFIEDSLSMIDFEIHKFTVTPVEATPQIHLPENTNVL